MSNRENTEWEAVNARTDEYLRGLSLRSNDENIAKTIAKFLLESVGRRQDLLPFIEGKIVQTSVQFQLEYPLGHRVAILRAGRETIRHAYS